ncbi:TIGR00180 family glycosyltransferase [Polaromonas sp.]|jgi:glycosyltransferase domain-containing protein|uniref:TIGR00180 family glycosyltransferase n=1 Tax=Polaromonas sp. TaxID=1869339 RepID=UPI0037CCA87A
MNQLTFLLTLKNRADYSRTWLLHNIRPGYDYLIADGSTDNENEALFSNLNLLNVAYVRYPEDATVAIYVDKVFDAISRVKTPYIMMCDNDDFINFHGVPGCIAALDAHPDVVCAGGPLIGISHITRPNAPAKYSLPFRIVVASAPLHNRQGFDALQQMFRNYSHMYYNVFRSGVCREIWRDIRQLEIRNVFLIELLQAELTFCHGKYFETRTNHYIRLTNPTSSAARDASANDIPPNHKIYFDEEYRAEVLRISRHVAALLQVDLKVFLDQFKFFYIGKRTLPKIMDILSLQFRSRIVAVLPHFRIGRIMALVNFFNRVGRP